jgi:hypothetical protein
VGGACSTHARDRNQSFIQKTQKKGQLQKPKHRWKDVRMDLYKTGCEDVKWIQQPQDRVQRTGFCEHDKKNLSSINVDILTS